MASYGSTSIYPDHLGKSYGVDKMVTLEAGWLNTAQKNEGLIDFESDADGWDEAYGWEYMNAWAAYYHRSDVISDSVTARPNSGYYHLYKGSMRDEGSSGEGHDRATLVWNRHATYNPHAYPSTYYTLSDLNLRLYREDHGFLMDTDFALDNGHQVRIDSGLSATEMVIKVYSWSTSFAHGGSSGNLPVWHNRRYQDFPRSRWFDRSGSRLVGLCHTQLHPNLMA